MTVAYSSDAAKRTDQDKRVLAALRLWVSRNGVGDPRPAQLAALVPDVLILRRDVSAALQRLKKAGAVRRTHLGWELPAPEAQP